MALEPVRLRLFAGLASLIWILTSCPLGASSPTLNSAKVTQIQNDVRLESEIGTSASAPDPAPSQKSNASDRPAVVGDMVEGKKTLLTGRKSRAELLFNDNTIARLGANSVFSFK